MKNYLLDTHTFIWFVSDAAELSQKARNLMESEEANLFSEHSQRLGNGYQKLVGEAGYKRRIRLDTQRYAGE